MFGLARHLCGGTCCVGQHGGAALCGVLFIDKSLLGSIEVGGSSSCSAGKVLARQASESCGPAKPAGARSAVRPMASRNTSSWCVMFTAGSHMQCGGELCDWVGLRGGCETVRHLHGRARFCAGGQGRGELSTVPR